MIYLNRILKGMVGLGWGPNTPTMVKELN